MKKTNQWTVTKISERPAGKKGECFYCHQSIGSEHHLECVIRQRTVVVRLSLEIVKTVPESWDTESIEFQMNESSSCFDNEVERILDLMERLNKHEHCTCRIGEGEYVREATEEDEKSQYIFVEEVEG